MLLSVDVQGFQYSPSPVVPFHFSCLGCFSVYLVLVCPGVDCDSILGVMLLYSILVFSRHFASVLLVSPMSSRKAILPPVERESEGKIAFLDVQLEKKGLKILTSVFRKKTHTDRYLHFHSNHLARVNRGIIQCLRHRAEKVCNGSMRWPEIRHLRQVFKANGYPETVVKWNLQGRPIPTNFS